MKTLVQIDYCVIKLITHLRQKIFFSISSPFFFYLPFSLFHLVSFHYQIVSSSFLHFLLVCHITQWPCVDLKNQGILMSLITSCSVNLMYFLSLSYQCFFQLTTFYNFFLFTVLFYSFILPPPYTPTLHFPLLSFVHFLLPLYLFFFSFIIFYSSFSLPYFIIYKMISFFLSYSLCFLNTPSLFYIPFSSLLTSEAFFFGLPLFFSVFFFFHLFVSSVSQLHKSSKLIPKYVVYPLDCILYFQFLYERNQKQNLKIVRFLI